MAGKTITLDEEAYALLKRHRRGSESFSEVIKEHFESPAKEAGRSTSLKEILPELSLSEETLDTLERLVSERHLHPARAVDL